MLTLSYDRGSLILSGEERTPPPPAAGNWVWDARIGAFRALALAYRPVITYLTRGGIPHQDKARAYAELPAPTGKAPRPYPYQEQALSAWRKGGCGVVELPTGAGKTRLALMIMGEIRRATLVLAPTLDLVAQWTDLAREYLGEAVGSIGGGSFEIQRVTVSTYASAARHGPEFGNRFGLAIFDECHHLCGDAYAQSAEALIAPYRLGLTATLERPDGRHALLDSLIGPVVYRKAIGELAGHYLSEYETRVLHAEFTPAEEEAYRSARTTFLEFAAEMGISLSSAAGWQRFIYAASRGPRGREALAAYRRQKQLAFAAEAKFALLAGLLRRHQGERVLIFTNENRTAYEISRRFLVPLITHQTPLAERKETLARFRDARWPILATSKVLNEGVDVPAASVAVIVSGSASIREHVQRLGRILRKNPGKQAVLYELLTRGTSELGTSERRRRHDAYR